MIIKYDGYITFQRCSSGDGNRGEIRFKDFNELYRAKTIDDVCLKDEWDDISDIIVNGTFRLADGDARDELYKKIGLITRPGCKRLISTKERDYYTRMHEVIEALDPEKKYKWYITDFECFNMHNISDIGNSQLIWSTDRFLKETKKDDFQWVWGVFSAIPKDVSDAEILKYYPTCENDCTEPAYIYMDDAAIIQHPLARIEIVAEDSSSVFIVSDDKEALNAFKKLFPKSVKNYPNLSVD